MRPAAAAALVDLPQVDLLLTALPAIRAARALSAGHAQVLVRVPSHRARPFVDHFLLITTTVDIIILE